MNLMSKAQGAPYCLATSIEECPMSRFWVVQLDCGFDVYQSSDDASLSEPSAWMRLKLFCEDNNVKPMNMARANKDLSSDSQVNLDPYADGYYYMRRIRKMATYHPGYAGYSDCADGIGQLHKNTLKIIWELDDGRTEMEERQIDENPKSKLVSLIRK